MEIERQSFQEAGIMLEQEGPENLFGLFSEDNDGGYFCIYQPEDDKVLAQMRIYTCSTNLSIHEKDVLIEWSSDNTKCGVTIWGWMRGIFDIKDSKEACAPIENPTSPAITDPQWLEGFENCMDRNQFMEARGRYWREVARQYKPDLRPESELSPLKTNFILYERGGDKRFCVFEDEGDTGYLYLYDSEAQKILRHLHIYDHPKKLKVTRQDVDVVWSEDRKKCGVIIWGKMLGIIDLETGQEGRKVESRETPGIGDEEWLKGFEYLRD